MALIKASLLLLLHFLFFLHLSPISRSVLLASLDPNQDNLPVLTVDSKPNGHAFVGNSRELAVVAKRGGGGGGRGGGGGVRGGGGGVRGGGDGVGGGGDRRGGRGVVPIFIAGSHHRSSGEREFAVGWLGLSVLIGLILCFLGFAI